MRTFSARLYLKTNLKISIYTKILRMTQIIKTNSVDFNALVSKTSNISMDCQSQMINVLNKEFTEEENRWYIANLYVYMNYHPTKDFPINLETLVKLVGFANKENAKRTLKNNFTEGEDYKLLLVPRDEQVKTNGGAGLNKETVMLNIDTFKNMCMLVKTEKSKEIRKYYVKLENIYNQIVSGEIEDNKRQLERQKKLIEDKDVIIKNNEYVKKIEKHKFLIEKFKYKKCVYIAEIGKNLRKIGSSKNIETRLLGLNTDYGTCIFLDIFECDNFREIEDSILRDSEIVKNLYKNPVHNHKNPQEVVQLTDSFTYLHLIEIVNKYLKQGFFLSPDKQLESKRIDFLEYLIKEKQYSLTDIEKLSKITFSKQATIEEKDTDEQIVIGNKTEPVVEKLIKARSIDKIDPETLSVLETYESIGVVINNHVEEKFEYNQLYRSIIRNNIYRNFRWNYHGQPIEPTVRVTKMANCIETIVKLNKDKTKVIETFSTKKEVMKALNISHIQITKILENKELFNDFYYLKKSDCIDICKDIEIPKYNVPNAKKIKQVNVLTKQEFIYNSMQDVYKTHGLSRQTIRKYINEKKEYCGFLWEFLKE
jgi:phage anti-repressor protein